MLRDRFVTGLSNAKTQHTLLAEADLTFARAVEIATACEAAQKDVGYKLWEAAVALLSLEGCITIRDYSSSKEKSKNSENSNSQTAAKPNAPTSPCSGCGKLHWKKDCTFKDVVCHACNRKGHIKTVCHVSKSGNSGAIENVNFSNIDVAPTSNSSYDHVFNINSHVPSKPIVVKVCLNEREISMELDTGTAATIIPKDQYERIWPEIANRSALGHSMVNLNVYGGSPLTVLGEISVIAKLENCSHSCEVRVVVVKESGPCLLGRDLSRELKVISSDALNFVAAKADKLKVEFTQLFSEGLGCYQGKFFSIVVDPPLPAKFCKARTVPYTLREKVDKELSRLQEEGIISPISNSPWAAPVVPVLKSDGGIRLCGDYKLTVNRAASMDAYPIPSMHDLFSNLAGGVIFSKLDMSQVYAQLCLDDQSKQFTVINTHRGLFQYNRLSVSLLHLAYFNVR